MEVKIVERGEMREVIVLRRKARGKMVPVAKVLTPAARTPTQRDTLKAWLIDQGVPAGRQQS